MTPTAQLINALAAQRWPTPDAWCNCDTCRNSREAEAIRNGTLTDAEREAIAARLWDMPGIYQAPPAYIDYDAHEELHRTVYVIRWGRGKAGKEQGQAAQASLFD